MPKITITLTDRQASGFQAEADQFNAEKTAELARKNPPETWTPLTLEERFEQRMAAVGDLHAKEFVAVSRKETVEKIVQLEEADFVAIKASVDQKIPDVIKVEAAVEAITP